MNPYLILMLGYLLIFIEFYIPGAVMGVIGGILVASSVFIFTLQSESFLAILLYIFLVVIGLILLFKIALWKIKNADPSSSIYSDANQHGYKASHFDKKLIGKTGVVLSDLKPGGYIVIEGVQYQAISETGYIVKGEEVIVIHGQEDCLIVKQSK